MKLRLQSNYFKVLAAAMLLYAFYILSTIFKFELASYILSPMCFCTAGGISLFSFLRADRTKSIRFIYLLYAAASYAWMSGEIRWAVTAYQGYEPLADRLASALYLISNIAIFSAVIIYAVHQFKKWNRIQLFIDALTIALASGLMLWAVFFKRNQAFIVSFIIDDLFASVSTLLDLLIISLVVIWFFSARSGKMPGYIKLSASGLFVFATTDVMFYYNYAHNTYSSDSWLDVLYVASMLMLAFGSLLKRYSPDQAENLHYINNIGFRRRSMFLLIYPAISILLTGFFLPDALVFALIILIYHTVSSYIQTAIKNEELLRNQVEANEELVKRLSDQDSELVTLSELDILTKIPNRRYFLDVLDIMLRGRQTNQVVTLFYINIDRFKAINDIYGYDVGDCVLVEFSTRLKTQIQEGTVLARQGGDEFAILYCGEFNRSQVENQVRRLIRYCSEPLQVGEQQFRLTISVGISICPIDTTEAIMLMKYADIAMYRAKSKGYNRYAFFDPNFNESLRKKHEIELLLRQSDVEHDFELVYQPQFDLSTMQVVGAEALIRWKDKGQGFIPPDDFIPVAEEIGYINQIGAWVMKEAFRQTVAWNTGYGLELKVGINISPLQLVDYEFVETLQHFIADSNIKTMWLDAEITENVMLSNEPQMNEIFQLLHDLGITVSIDDFGTGYSTLNYLKRYPFNRIKIDKSLIDNIASSSSDREIVKAIIGMANSMGIKTIAEGVEQRSQLAVLQSLDCTEAQGFLLGRAVSPEVFEEKYIQKMIELVR